MAMPNVPDLSSLINQQIHTQQTLRDTLCKVSALLHVSLESEIFQYSKTTIHFYLWSISDLVERSQELNEGSLSELLAATTAFTDLA